MLIFVGEALVPVHLAQYSARDLALPLSFLVYSYTKTTATIKKPRNSGSCDISISLSDTQPASLRETLPVYGHTAANEESGLTHRSSDRSWFPEILETPSLFCLSPAVSYTLGGKAP